jgi:hypothetical protein
MGNYTQYNIVPALNNGAPPVGAAEGVAPSAINDIIRELMATVRALGDAVANGSLVGTTGMIPASRVQSSILPGTIIMSVNHLPPAGYLQCNGHTYLRSDYPELAGTIGSSYNNPDTPAHMFCVPDFRSTIPMGHDFMGNALRSNRVTTFPTNVMGARGGDQHPHSHSHEGVVWHGGGHSHSGVTDIVGDHAHVINIQPEGAHQHNVQMGGNYNVNNVVSQSMTGSNNIAGLSSTIVKPSGLHVHPANCEATGRHGHNIGTYPVPDHNHGLTIHPQFAGGQLNVQPSLIVMFFIKT